MHVGYQRVEQLVLVDALAGANWRRAQKQQGQNVAEQSRKQRAHRWDQKCAGRSVFKGPRTYIRGIPYLGVGGGVDHRWRGGARLGKTQGGELGLKLGVDADEARHLVGAEVQVIARQDARYGLVRGRGAHAGWTCRAASGVRVCQSVTCWYASPTRSTIASSKGLPTICMPIGRPAFEKPQQTLAAGRPVRFQMAVKVGAR